jgi:stage V sporulation protein G
VCRELIQSAVIQELQGELARAGEPGYRSRYDDEFDVNDAGPETDDSETFRQTVPKPHFNQSPNQGQPNQGQPNQGKSNQRQSSSTKSQSSSTEDNDFGAGIF